MIPPIADRFVAGEIPAEAVDRGVRVRFDMEEHRTVDRTLDAFEDLAREHGGVCLQADLKRSRRDAERLADVPGTVRFVKGGSYPHPDGVAFRGATG